MNFDNESLWNGDSGKENADFVIDAQDGFIVNANNEFGADRAFTIESGDSIVGGLWGDGDTLFMHSRSAHNIQIFAGASARLVSGNLFIDVNEDNVIIETSTGDCIITNLPESEPLGPDRMYTQTASELGGSGTEKVLCISAGSAPSTPSPPSICKDGDMLRVSWNSVSGADSYDIQRSVDGGAFEGWITGVSSTQANDIIPERNPDTTFEYQVRACNTQGCSSYSTPSASTTFNTASSC